MTSPDETRPDEPGSGSPAPPVQADLTPLPGLIRLITTWRAMAWTTGTALHTGTAILTRTLQGDPPVAILIDVVEEIRGAVIAVLGGPDPAAGRYGSAGPVRRDTRAPDRAATPAELRARGAALLDLSADVTATADDAGHPAYARMLSELTPDEARILRLLCQAGSQPALDIRTNRPLGIGSELVAGGLNMIAEHAGLRRMDRIYPYLTNLNRQGLIDFSKEQVNDPDRYQLIEAQPNVSEARARAGRAPKIVYRSIRLTTFGRDFCQACLPTNGDAGGRR
jgi:Abortive infection alpha